MTQIIVGAAALNQIPGGWEENRDRIIESIRMAKSANVQLLCLPELCISGYGCEDLFLSRYVLDASWEALQEIVSETQGIYVCLGLPIRHENRLYNCACIVGDGDIHGIVPKQRLASDGIHYENRWFRSWPKGEVATYLNTIPFGDIIFDIGGVRVGIEICRDAWVIDRPLSRYAGQGIDILLNPSASHFSIGKHAIRRRFTQEASRAAGCAVVYTNLIGCESGRAIYEGDSLIASDGKIIAQAKRFSFEHVTMITAPIDLDLNRQQQMKLSLERAVKENSDVVRIERALTTIPVGHEPQAALDSEIKISIEEEVTDALVLGLFDYLRKSKAQGYVVSLSGGADSAAVSCLVALMTQKAWKELGAERFNKALHNGAYVKSVNNADEGVKALLLCVGQHTKNNSSYTRNSAKELANELGAHFVEYEINGIIDSYVGLIKDALKRELSWGTDDIALQNIQSRTRVPGVWLLANVTGKVLLNTGNRSELSTGYFTIDGDSAGGLSPLGGIDKHFILKWLQWLEESGPSWFKKISALKSINETRPTAELRPQSAKQTDEADLMPYEVLSVLEREAIKNRRTPLDVYRVVARDFNQKYKEKELKEWVIKFFCLFSQSQWKRERAAPAFQIDDFNVDPRSWGRFPILSGQFERELRLLEGNA